MPPKFNRTFTMSMWQHHTDKYTQGFLFADDYNNLACDRNEEHKKMDMLGGLYKYIFLSCPGMLLQGPTQL